MNRSAFECIERIKCTSRTVHYFSYRDNFPCCAPPLQNQHFHEFYYWLLVSGAVWTMGCRQFGSTSYYQ